MNVTDIPSGQLAVLHDLPAIGTRVRTVGRVCGIDVERSLIWLQDRKTAVLAYVAVAVGSHEAAHMPRVKDLVMLIADVDVNKLTILPERDQSSAQSPAHTDEYHLLHVIRMWPCDQLDLQLWEDVAQGKEHSTE